MTLRQSAAVCGLLCLLTFAQTPAAAEGVDPRSGEVRIYVSLATQAAARLVQQLAPHFPNLKINFVRAGSVETVNRFVAERQAGRVFADLLHSADPGGFDYFAERGWIDARLADPSVTEAYLPGFFNAKEGWVAMRATGIAMIYNTNLLKQEEAPRSWTDLLDPKWKGKIAISDPTRAGSSFSHLYAMWKLYGRDYLEKLAQNEVFVAGDGAATRNAVANGERPIAPVSEYDAFYMKHEGLPVEVIWPADGTIVVPAPLALVKGAPNADNALALGRYLLSQEGQQQVATIVDSWSARKDVPAPSGKPELKDLKIAAVDWSKAGAEKNALLDLYFTYFQSK